jgi:RimJ/RimL family protein N-acetyltransferase
MPTTAAPLFPSPLFPWMTRDEVFRIETPRLWLRWPRLGDADALHAIAAQASVATMTATWPHPLPDGEAARRIASARDLNASGEALVLAITLKSAPDRLVGQIGCNALPSEYLGVGYMLDPKLSGRGLATEALRGFVDAIFTYSRLKTLTASCRLANGASKRVLERNGFAHSGRGPLDTDVRGKVEVDYFELTRVRWARQADASHAAMLKRVARRAGQDGSEKVPA